jgi:hypothetical protein
MTGQLTNIDFSGFSALKYLSANCTIVFPNINPVQIDFSGPPALRSLPAQFTISWPDDFPVEIGIDFSGCPALEHCTTKWPDTNPMDIDLSELPAVELSALESRCMVSWPSISPIDQEPSITTRPAHSSVRVSRDFCSMLPSSLEVIHLKGKFTEKEWNALTSAGLVMHRKSVRTKFEGWVGSSCRFDWGLKTNLRSAATDWCDEDLKLNQGLFEGHGG